MSFKGRERALQVRWMRATKTLSDAACRPGVYVAPPKGRFPRGRGRRDEMFLHEEHSPENLLPAVRDEALRLYTELGIVWHEGPKPELPSNYLLDSMVGCVNALLPLAHAPEALATFFSPLVSDAIGSVIVEGDRYLTFEWIGLDNPLAEVLEGRKRGSRATSIDAYCILKTALGRHVGLAIEWKYTESYEGSQFYERAVPYYAHHFDGPDSPLDCRSIGGEEALFYNPFYQLARSQVLAHKMEKSREVGVDEVHFVLIVPQENRAYRESVTSPRLAATFPGVGVVGIWEELQRKPDRFACTSLTELMGSFDEELFPAITDAMREVRLRYVEGRDG